MANFTKFTKAQKAVIMRHVQRENREYSNKNIDHERTYLNYDLIERDNVLDYTNQRIEQSQHLTRENIVQLIGFTFTMPKDYDGNSRDLFAHAYEFIEKDFGRDNIAYATVHMDETTPHLHIGIIPITDDNRLCAKELIDRTYLQHFHDRLQEHLREREPERTINIQREAEKEKSLPMHEYKIAQKEKELAERTHDLRDSINSYNEQVKEINRAYDSMQRTYDYIDKVHHFCDRMGISEYAYHTHEYYANRGDRDHFAPEKYNPERTQQERDRIAQRLEEQRREFEHEHTRDRGDRDDRGGR